MDYENMYKAALKRAREVHRNEDDKRSTMEFLFPELKESEDEKIRKEIIYHIQNCDDTIDEVTEKRMIVWLEKQGEKKIEDKPLVIGEGKSEMDYCFTKMMNGEKINSAWNEEDENKVTLFMQLTEGCDNEEELADWLKSLKERMKGE